MYWEGSMGNDRVLGLLEVADWDDIIIKLIIKCFTLNSLNYIKYKIFQCE